MSAEIAIVLGSGLGSLADALSVEREVSFAEAGLPSSKVAGHAGRFLLGKCFGQEMWIMQGRVHLYEGHPAHDVAAGVRWLAGQGVKRLILTNAAGSLRAGFSPGEWMMLSDHINLTGTSPLEGGANFIDMSQVYSAPWRARMRDCAKKLMMPLHEGVYAGLRGPQYETPAEIRMLQVMGADAVGMSTVLEALQARALGMEVMGFSCLTNWGAGLSAAGLNHSEVLHTGQSAAAQMMRLLQVSVADE